MKKKTKAVSPMIGGILLVFLFVLLLISIVASITFGNADISVKEVYSVIAYELFHMERFASFSQGAVHDIVWLIRFPRVMMAVAIGMGLSVCGVVMQAIVKNPMADPYILGISSGASMGATLAILFGIGTIFGTNFVGIMAFLGAIFVSFAVLLIANIGGEGSTSKLVLAGMAMSAICTAFSNFAIYLAHNQNATSEVLFWTMGSLASAKWSTVQVVLPIMIVGMFFFWSQFRSLNLMLLGEETAITLGTNIRRRKIFYLIVTSCMVGFAVYSAGTIGFVGLIIPHAIRIIMGADHKRLIPMSALVGAIFLLWADVCCRVLLKNSELPIGILVSMIGAPCFIYLLLKKTYGFGGARH